MEEIIQDGKGGNRSALTWCSARFPPNTWWVALQEIRRKKRGRARIQHSKTPWLSFVISIRDGLSRTSLFCWRNFSHEERRMGDCEAVWSIESSVVDCLGNEEAVVHEQSFFLRLWELGESCRGVLCRDINQDLCPNWGSSFLFGLAFFLFFAQPIQKEEIKDDFFQLLLFDNLVGCSITQKTRCKKEGKETDLLWPRNFRHVKCHLWHSGDWEVTKDWICLEHSNFQHCFSSIIIQLVVMGGNWRRNLYDPL